MTNRSSFRFSATRLGFLPLVLVAAFPALPVRGAGEVTAVETDDAPASPSSYTIGGETIAWGLGSNLTLEAFVAGGTRYEPLRSADRTEVRRVDVPGVATGPSCGLFAERLDGSGARLAPDYPALGGGGNCDTAATLDENLINRGVLNLFSNRGSAPKNIERVDFLFLSGINAPFDPGSITRAGHLVGDKSGNNAVQMAAVLALDADDMPSAYGPLVRIGPFGCADPDICYGDTGLIHPYTFLQSASVAPQSGPMVLTTLDEPVGLAFVSVRALGLEAGQRYHGVSLFADDVDAAVHDLLDPATFPADTEDRSRGRSGDDVDLYGGGAPYYVGDIVARGRITCATSADDASGGIPGIDVSLRIDTDGDGVFDPDRDPPLGGAVASGADGRFAFPGLSDGSYFLQLDADDAGFPAGSTLVSTDPLPFVVAGDDVTSLDFRLDCPDQLDPVANPDTVALDQSALGVPIAETPIDVLGNDVDPRGEGLRVVEVDGATLGGAIVAEDGGAVLYTPDEGIAGDDTFTYTLEDGAGRRDSATVTVSVRLLPEAPGCFDGDPGDDCVLQTEVDGHGLGYPRAASLIALLAVLLGRVRRRGRPGVAGERP